MQLVGFSSDAEPVAWEKAGGELGLLNIAAGQRWSAPSAFPRLSGVIDTLGKGSHKNTVLIRLDSPAPGTAYIGAFSCGGMVMVCLSVYLYGGGAKPAITRDEPAWQAWMSQQFPAPPMA